MDKVPGGLESTIKGGGKNEDLQEDFEDGSIEILSTLKGNVNWKLYFVKTNRIPYFYQIGIDS